MNDYLALAKMGQEANRMRGIRYAEQVRWFIEPLVAQSLSLRSIAKSLNEYRVKTPTGVGEWSHKNVARMVYRLGLREAA